MRGDAECPSLSPDGTRIWSTRSARPPARAMAAGRPRPPRGAETVLAEKHTVDDQVEWLDDDHVMYALQGKGGDPYLNDVFMVPADGSGSPGVLIRHASSPSVVR